MKISFITPTKLSLIDIISMGDSSKRNDPTTIGQFDSGLKYAIALLLRNNVDIEINVYDNDVVETFRFDTFTEKCESTDKEKELIGVTKSTFTGYTTSDEYHKTGFAKQLGYNWELWMAFRELYSNMLDEKGYLIDDNDDIPINNGTTITLEFDESNPFYEIYQNKHLYINTSNRLFSLSPSIDILRNDENYLRIYKQNVLVYIDKNKPSLYAYNIRFGEIDERRILNNLYSIEHSIIDAIATTKNEDYLRTIIKHDIEFDKNEFLSDLVAYQTCNDLINKIVTDVYNEYGEVKSYSWILDLVKKREDCAIGGKKIQSIKSSIYNYSREVTIETEPQILSQPIDLKNDIFDSTLSLDIKKLYNFNLDVEVRMAVLSGGRKVIADKHAKCLIIDEEFDVENTIDMSAFIVEYIDLTTKGNVVENLGNYILKLIKK